MSAGEWSLVAPDWAEIDTLWRNPKPFVLWPVCGKPILSYWLDEALHHQATRITVHASDRPHLVRMWLEKGDLWSTKVEVSPGEPPSANTIRSMERLPSETSSERVVDGPSLLRRWHAMHLAALKARASEGLHIDREIQPGIWAGPGAMISPTAVLEGPCWIGARARIGDQCRLGPAAFVGRNSVLDDRSGVRDGIVCEQTYLGRHTHLENGVLQGGLLMNWQLGTAVHLAEDFIAADLRTSPLRSGIFERFAALFLWMVMAPAARLWNFGRRPVEAGYTLPGGNPVSLSTWGAGPLLVRRSPWLLAVVSGHLRLLGVLPRSQAHWDKLPPETRAILEKCPAGVLTLSDLHECHDASQPEEWIHAAYQAGSPDGEGWKRLHREFWNLALRTPLA